MSRSTRIYNRPIDLPDEEKKRIEDMFGEWVFIDWKAETIMFNSSPIPMEKLGKMLGIMQQYCITVRQPKDKTTIK